VSEGPVGRCLFLGFADRRRFRLLLVLVAAFSSPLALRSHVFAQAWTPPKGEASLGLSYQNFYTRDHLFAHGEALELGKIRMNVIFFDLNYGITDRLALSASLPYVYSRYDGSVPHQLPVDNGDYHGTFADYRFDVRYNALKDPAVVTPFAAAIIPSHHYLTFAHSAASVGLKEYLVGLNFGRRLDPLLSSAFIQARTSYAFAERLLGVSHNRSNYDLELGYFVTPSLSLSATGSYQQTHGGIDFPLVGTPEFKAFVNSPYWPVHDQIARADFLNVGGGVSYALTGSVDVSASYVTMVWGKNIHKISPGLVIGFNYGFSPQQLVKRFFPTSPPRVASEIQ
jgi:hypothetical protein